MQVCSDVRLDAIGSEERAYRSVPQVEPEMLALVQQLALISARLSQLTSGSERAPETLTVPVTKRCPDGAETTPSTSHWASPSPSFQRHLNTECHETPERQKTPEEPVMRPDSVISESSAAKRLLDHIQHFQDVQVRHEQALSELQSLNASLHAENKKLREELENASVKSRTRAPRRQTTLGQMLASDPYESVLSVLCEEEPPGGGPAVRGLQAVSAFQKISEDILAEMRIREATSRRSFSKQDVMYQTMGVKGLIGHGKRIKARFDRFGEALAKFTGSEFMPCNLKSHERAGSKTKISYCGDCTQLKDVVRGTLAFDATVPGALGRLYSTVRRLCLDAPSLSADLGTTFEMLSLKDRFQSPLMGGYRDILCVLSLHGYLCELQLNLTQVLTIKNSQGHKQYEFLRLAVDELLCACADDNAMKAQLNLTVLLGALGTADPMDSRSWLQAKDYHKATCLHYAAFHLNAALVQELLEAKADVLAEDVNGRVPLELAAKIASPEGKKAKMAANDGQVLLMLFESMAVVPRGSFRRLSRQACESVLRVFNLNGGTDHQLVSPCWPVECETLAGQIFSRLCKSQVRALVAAAEAGLSGIVTYLQGFEIPLNSAMLNSEHCIVTALDSAVLQGHPAMASMLAQQGGRFWCLGDRDDDGLRACVSNEVEWGVHMDLQAAAERYASDEGKLAVRKLQALLALSSPADIDAKKVLEAATYREGPERGLVVLLILSQWHGALRFPGEAVEVLSPLLDQAVAECDTAEGSYKIKEVLACGEAGTSAKNRALWSAASLGHPVAIRVLLDAKADAAAAGLWGNTPLHNLCLTGRDPDSVALLLQRRANPAAENLAGKMPLHYIGMGVGEDCVKMAKLLVEARADINAEVLPSMVIQQSEGYGANEPFHYEIGSGKSLLHFAVQSSVPLVFPLVQFCLEHMADPNAVDTHGRSPLHFAVSHAAPDVIQLLLDAKAQPDARCHAGESPKCVVQRELSQPWHQESPKAVSKFQLILKKVSFGQ
eukprot:gnl/MRDRNA2_/MRDRNA2_77466_c0_seq1.p1 gnl/MRDRNA2_/MRDRNA2_77466_c0~~gnl/MRDRNA2_/MRDRNA2_77466_c0_seq1.p1  ORF type:complete len:1007 (+),score=182.79 gnl/MRDRNA2_/MRDRNA2_77466_c0_seq1:83-3103(+)